MEFQQDKADDRDLRENHKAASIRERRSAEPGMTDAEARGGDHEPSPADATPT